jgi:putative ABC transport system substrate-binding protein
LINPSDQVVERQTVENVQPVARSLNVTVRTPDDIDRAFAKRAEDAMQGVFSAPDPMLFNERQRTADLALASRLPVVFPNRPGAVAGGFMSYGTDARAIFRRAAAYVDKIIKGRKPAIPIEQPTKFELIINLKTAKALGLTVPPALLARADEVIE